MTVQTIRGWTANGREESTVQHITTIDERDGAGHWSWRCTDGDADASGYESLVEAVAAAQDHGPLAADALSGVECKADDAETETMVRYFREYYGGSWPNGSWWRTGPSAAEGYDDPQFAVNERAPGYAWDDTRVVQVTTTVTTAVVEFE